MGEEIKRDETPLMGEERRRKLIFVSNGRFR